ncbi:hypothetical protein IMCC21906_01406 [Spongiibacter sp. IMCC21906]|uniref:hypothetical protein n=1 Tax=Spongiibacter sp. IMCC21906 TaxID=1620392 RepID=UPI00062E02F1|nr:hypothetical protein [Spongiibacter sp. IMCC21906]AKH69084.1 hypothetical protein IMCC21906_01406 [Spongiibacter sp. IMCC21906]
MIREGCLIKTAFLAGLFLLLAACASRESIEYSPGFSFADYRYVVIERGKNSGVYGLDLKLVDAFNSNQLQVVGDKEVRNLPYADQKRTLGAQLSVDGNDDRVLLGLSLQNFLTGRVIATIGWADDGDLFDKSDRNKAFAKLLEELSAAIRKDRQPLPGAGTAKGVAPKPAAKPVPAEAPASSVHRESPEDRPYTLKPDFSE